MPIRIAVVATALSAALLAGATPARAECKDLKQFVKDETQGVDKFVDMFTFRKNHKGDSVLMLIKDSTQKGRPPKRWLFLHRPDAASEEFCALGRGETFGQHDDVRDAAYSDKFGAPGSGFARCASATATATPDLLLRAWASRELGGGIVLYAQSQSTSGFQFAISDDSDWILIEDPKTEPTTSCFFDRGTDLFTRFNIMASPQ